MKGLIHISISPESARVVGSQPPKGYLARSEWADTQWKAGLRQKPCGMCGKWKFPQEMSDKKTASTATIKDNSGRGVTLTSWICNQCNESEVTE